MIPNCFFFAPDLRTSPSSPLPRVDLARAQGGGDDAEALLAAGGQLGPVRLLRRRRQEPQDGAPRRLGAHQVRLKTFITQKHIKAHSGLRKHISTSFNFFQLSSLHCS